MFGRMPPPIGGVTKSIQNYQKALISQGHYVDMVSLRNIFKRYQVGHIHFSIPWKRFLGLLLAKLISRKVAFTIHGNVFDLDNQFNRLVLKYSDVAIVLNSQMKEKLEKVIGRKAKIVHLSSIVKEGITLSSNLTQYRFIKKLGHVYGLLYINNSDKVNRKLIYGADFIADLLYLIPPNFMIIVVDLSEGEENSELASHPQIEYVKGPVNFTDLLSKVEVYLRPTVTDGDSLAIREALALGVRVLASDVIDRPKGVITYRHLSKTDFIDKLNVVINLSRGAKVENSELSSIEEYLKAVR